MAKPIIIQTWNIEWIFKMAGLVDNKGSVRRVAEILGSGHTRVLSGLLVAPGKVGSVVNMIKSF
jgi:hypothetical protein